MSRSRQLKIGSKPSPSTTIHAKLNATLSELGVIELVPEGRSKRPVAQYDDIQVHYSLVNDEPASERAGG
jgi:predicted transcriptional regulator